MLTSSYDSSGMFKFFITILLTCVNFISRSLVISGKKRWNNYSVWKSKNEVSRISFILFLLHRVKVESINQPYFILFWNIVTL